MGWENSPNFTCYNHLYLTILLKVLTQHERGDHGDALPKVTAATSSQMAVLASLSSGERSSYLVDQGYLKGRSQDLQTRMLPAP